MTLEERALAWAVRQPLLTPRQLAALCGAGIDDIQSAISRLRRTGWLLVPDPPVPGMGRDPLIAVGTGALQWLERQPGPASPELRALQRWHSGLQVLAEAVASGPVTRTLNAAMAATALAIRRGGAGELVATAHRPPRGRKKWAPDDPWQPLPWGHMEGLVRAGDAGSRFALFCDRPELPTELRAELLRNWRGADPIPQGDPLLLVLCPTEDEQERWIELRRHIQPVRPRVAFALQRAICGGFGLEDPVLQAADSYHRASLEQLLQWSDAPATEQPGESGDVHDVGGLPDLAEKDSLHALREPHPSAPATRRRAGVLMGLSEEQHWMLRLLARQLWLSSEDIACIAGSTLLAVERALNALRQSGAATSAESPDGQRRWRLAEDGMYLAAAYAGAARNWQAFARETMGYRRRAKGRLDAPSAHAAGVSRTAGLIAAAARRGGLRLEGWYSERWWRGEISRTAPVPDGAVRLRARGDDPIVAMVEYERLRGGPRGPLKIEPWVEWYGAKRWQGLRGPLRANADPPLLLIVYDEKGRQHTGLLKSLERAPAGLPMVAATEEELTRDGLHGPVWRHAGGGKGPAVAERNG